VTKAILNTFSTMDDNDEDSNMSLDQMWREAEERFKKLTNKKLRDPSKARLEDVIKSLDAKPTEKGPDDQPAKDRAMRIMQNVLNLVKLLGGIAAEAVSTVSDCILGVMSNNSRSLAQ
jgi:fungal STAND N-terminal Goodbye domain